MKNFYIITMILSSKILTQIILTVVYSSNITDNITVQCSLCAKELYGQQPH